MKENFTSIPSRSRPRLFLGCLVRPSAWSPRASDARSPAARASSGLVRGTHAVDRPQTPLPSYVGFEQDGFPSEDRRNLHLVNLIKDRIGAQHIMSITVRHEDY